MFVEAPPEPPAPVCPPAPATLEETGLGREMVTDLVCKILHGSNELTGSELTKRIGLSFAVIDPSLDFLKSQSQCAIAGGTLFGNQSFRYRLTDAGHDRALRSLDRSQYSGVAPVPITQYRRYMQRFTQSTSDAATPEDVREAFADLVVSERVLSELGPAICARQSIFIYGPPGNGKSVMASSIRRVLSGDIAIPYAVEVGGNIIRFFDPAVHEPVAGPPQPEGSEARVDQRWIQCRRPMVSVGGELTLEMLALAYNSRSGVYRAPVQTLANGGILVIDDFGRQRCSPRDLLNWWMVPLETGIEYMTLHSGEKVEMPFETLVVFSTNIRPSELVDEAFLRRIQYKIYAESPTREAFGQIFERCCRAAEVSFDQTLVDGLLDGIYRTRHVQLRGCHPRDLIRQALAIGRYQGEPRRLTSELLHAACLSYFIDDHEAPR